MIKDVRLSNEFFCIEAVSILDDASPKLWFEGDSLFVNFHKQSIIY